MGAYLIRRLLLVIPTLWAIITINFFIVQIAPGGPVDQAIAAIEFGNAGVLPGAGGEGIRASHAQTGVGNISDSNYRGGRGLDPEVIAEITHRYGFDKRSTNVTSKCSGTTSALILVIAFFAAPRC